MNESYTTINFKYHPEEIMDSYGRGYLSKTKKRKSTVCILSTDNLNEMIEHNSE